jgi:hypothetical protein
LFPEVNFDEDLRDNPELAEYIRHACATNATGLDDPRKRQEAPKLNDDFSKIFVINNLPKCDEAKSKKLKQLLIKLLDKKKISLTENDIDMTLNNSGMTDGVAIILLSTEE